MVVYPDDKGSYEVIQSTDDNTVSNAIAETTPNRPSIKKDESRRSSTTASYTSETSGEFPGPPKPSRHGISSTNQDIPLESMVAFRL